MQQYEDLLPHWPVEGEGLHQRPRLSRPLHLEAGTASNALTHPMSELANIISIVRAGECLVKLSARVCITLLDPGRAGRP